MPGLLPFAVLTQTANRSRVLQAVAERVEAMPDGRQRSNVAAASSILAGLVLEKDVIIPSRSQRRNVVQASCLRGQDARTTVLWLRTQIGIRQLLRQDIMRKSVIY